MAKVPKYKVIEARKAETIQAIEKYQDKVSFALKINKLNSYELLREMILGTKLPLMVKNSESWNVVSRIIAQKTALNFLKIIFEKSDTFINGVTNIQAVPHLFYHYSRGEARNKIEDWKPKRRHHTNQLKDLINFLFLKHRVPDFLYSSFIGHDEGMELFFHITNGRPFKNFPFVPALKLNKKVYHHLFTTPEDFNYFQAFRRAQILSLGGDERLVNGFMRSKLGNVSTTHHDDFWVTVIQLFVGTNMFDMDKISEIVDYIEAQKYGSRLIRGEYRTPAPNLSMKGRTPLLLLEKSDDWHKEMAHEAKMAQRVIDAEWRGVHGRYARYRPTPPPNISWAPKAIRNFSQKIKKRENGNSIEYTQAIIQLNTTKDLIKEAAEMKNCVYSYVSSCSNGSSAIFSMQETDIVGNVSRVMTIEVRNYQITQARLRSNSRVTNGPLLEMMKLWAGRENLGISPNAL